MADEQNRYRPNNNDNNGLKSLFEFLSFNWLIEPIKAIFSPFIAIKNIFSRDQPHNVVNDVSLTTSIFRAIISGVFSIVTDTQKFLTDVFIEKPAQFLTTVVNGIKYAVRSVGDALVHGFQTLLHGVSNIFSKIGHFFGFGSQKKEVDAKVKAKNVDPATNIKPEEPIENFFITTNEKPKVPDATQERVSLGAQTIAMPSVETKESPKLTAALLKAHDEEFGSNARPTSGASSISSAEDADFVSCDSVSEAEAEEFKEDNQSTASSTVDDIFYDCDDGLSVDTNEIPITKDHVKALGQGLGVFAQSSQKDNKFTPAPEIAPTSPTSYRKH